MEITNLRHEVGYKLTKNSKRYRGDYRRVEGEAIAGVLLAK